MSDGLISRLARKDRDSWNDFVRGFDGAREPDPEAARRLLDAAPFGEWVELAKESMARCEDFLTISRPLRAFRAWLVASAEAAFPVGDERLWSVRVHAIRFEPGSDGGHAAARQLYDEMRDEGAADGRLGEVALLVSKGATTNGDHQEALEFASIAVERWCAAGDHHHVAQARRRCGGALLCLKRYDEAFEMLAEPMETRGPLFGGGGASVSRAIEDPLDAALDEAATIVTWADQATPEWVRAVGGIAEGCDDEATKEALWTKFGEAMRHMLEATRDPESDIEVVVRQSGQRGLMEAPLRALEAYLVAYPDDDWARAQVTIIGRHQRVEREIVRLGDAAEEAVAGLVAVLDEEEREGTLGENDLSYRVIDALVDHFLATRDERALEVQQRVLDAKLAKFGDCPAAWLEEQNLATLLCQLGRRDEGIARAEAALEKQVGFFGPDHPHSQRTRNNLERMRSEPGWEEDMVN